jgi:hypothetical protein
MPLDGIVGNDTRARIHTNNGVRGGCGRIHSDGDFPRSAARASREQRERTLGPVERRHEPGRLHRQHRTA